MQTGPTKKNIDPGSVLAQTKTEPNFGMENLKDNSQSHKNSKQRNSIEMKQELFKTKKDYFNDGSDVQQLNNDENNSNTAYEFLRKAIPLPGAMISSFAHLYAFSSHILNPSNNERIAADSQALTVSKVALVSNCLLQTYEALKKNRLVEAFSRFIEPLFIVAEKRVEDLGLARGIGLGISQLVGSQEGIVNELAKQKLGFDPTKKGEAQIPTMGQDLDLNFSAFKKLFAESVKGGLGKNRRFLTGLSIDNIKDKSSKFLSEFNLASISDLFKSNEDDYRERFKTLLKSSGLQHIKDLFQGNPQLDKGHTDALSGYLMIIGSLMGYMDKASKGILYKIGGTIRNLGGTVADIALFGHKDPDFNISSMFLSVNTVMDMVQRFIPAKMLNVILPWSNFSMAAYNIGVSIYLNRSNKKSNEGDEIEYHDTDIAPKSQLKFQDEFNKQGKNRSMVSMLAA
jgi:hypothetical protein